MIDFLKKSTVPLQNVVVDTFFADVAQLAEQLIRNDNRNELPAFSSTDCVIPSVLCHMLKFTRIIDRLESIGNFGIWY